MFSSYWLQIKLILEYCSYVFFCIVTLLNLFTDSKNFQWVFLKSFSITSRHSTVSYFTRSLFLISIVFYFNCRKFFLVRSIVTCGRKNSKNKYKHIVPDIRRKAFRFSTLSMMQLWCFLMTITKLRKSSTLLLNL